MELGPHIPWAQPQTRFERLEEFTKRGFQCSLTADPANGLFLAYIKNPHLGQSFSFHFEDQYTLVAWARNERIRPRRIVRRFFEAEGLGPSKVEEMPLQSAEELILELVPAKKVLSTPEPYLRLVELD